jgi:predicted metal-binding membrane protein
LNGSFEKIACWEEGEKEALLCCGCCWTSTPTMVGVGTIANIRCLSSWVLCEFVEKESFHIQREVR